MFISEKQKRCNGYFGGKAGARSGWKSLPAERSEK